MSLGHRARRSPVSGRRSPGPRISQAGVEEAGPRLPDAGDGSRPAPALGAGLDRWFRVRSGVARRDAGHRRSAGGVGPEAVGAVDGPVHAWLERDLGLVAAGRAEDREVLANRPVAALVAPRAADVADVGLAGIAGRASQGPAAGAALGVGDEPLLCVELLVRGRVDELDAAVDAGEGSIGVGQPGPPGRVKSVGVRPGHDEEGRGRAVAGAFREPRDPGRSLQGACIGLHR